jgi:hypothetical protein
VSIYLALAVWASSLLDCEEVLSEGSKQRWIPLEWRIGRSLWGQLSVPIGVEFL